MKTYTLDKTTTRLFSLLAIFTALTLSIECKAQSTALRLTGIAKYDYVSNTWHQVDSVRYGWWSNFGGDLDHSLDNWKITAREEINSNYVSINWGYLDLYTYNLNNQVVLKTFAQWDGSVYQFTNRYTDSFDTQGHMIQELEESWIAGAWQVSSLTLDSLGSNGLVAQEYLQSWQTATNSWKPSNITTYDYNAAGLRTLYQRVFWNGSAWLNQEQLIDVYDDANRPLTETSTTGSGTAWVNDMRHSYQYDANGNQTIYSFYQWNTSSNTWKNVWRDLYTYNSNNLVTGWTDQNYSTQWDNNYKVDYTYNSANLKETTLESRWTGTWNNYYMILDQYNTRGFVTVEKVQYWDGSAFVDSTRATTARNNADQTLNILNETYTAGAWSTKGAEYRYYEQYAPVTGIEGTTTNSNVKAYPNPFIKNCVIEFNNETSGENLIQLFDLNGKLVRQETAYFPAGNNKWLFDGNSNAGEEIIRGIYILKISNGQQVSTQKISKL